MKGWFKDAYEDHFQIIFIHRETFWLKLFFFLVEYFLLKWKLTLYLSSQGSEAINNSCALTENINSHKCLARFSKSRIIWIVPKEYAWVSEWFFDISSLLLSLSRVINECGPERSSSCYWALRDWEENYYLKTIFTALYPRVLISIAKLSCNINAMHSKNFLLIF